MMKGDDCNSIKEEETEINKNELNFVGEKKCGSPSNKLENLESLGEKSK